MCYLKQCFAVKVEILRQARNRVKGGVLCRRSEPLTRSAACRIPVHQGEAHCRCCMCAGEVSRRSIVQCAVRALQVVVVTPPRQPLSRVVQRAEPLHVQTLIAQPSVEAFDVAVLYRPPGADKAQLDPMLNRPGSPRSPGELTAVVQGDAPRCPAAFHDRTSQCSNDMPAMERPIRFHGDTFAGELIDHRQDPIGASVRQLVADEIGRPALVRSRGRTMRNPLPAADLLPLHAAHFEVLLVVKPVDAPGVHRPALSAQQYRQAPIAIAHMRCRALAQTPAKRFLQRPSTDVLQGAPRKPDHARRPSHRNPVRLLRPPRQPTFLARLYSFFDTISCRICRSRVRSATMRFSRPFSSRRLRSSRSSCMPSPAYCFFHM